MLRQADSFEREKVLKPDAGAEEEEAGELIDNSSYCSYWILLCVCLALRLADLLISFIEILAGNLHIGSIYAPLENFDKDTIAAKRAQLSALGNRRIWASLGLEDKLQRTRVCGLVVSKTGEVTYVRPMDK